MRAQTIACLNSIPLNQIEITLYTKYSLLYNSDK